MDIRATLHDEKLKLLEEITKLDERRNEICKKIDQINKSLEFDLETVQTAINTINSYCIMKQECEFCAMKALCGSPINHWNV